MIGSDAQDQVSVDIMDDDIESMHIANIEWNNVRKWITLRFIDMVC